MCLDVLAVFTMLHGIKIDDLVHQTNEMHTIYKQVNILLCAFIIAGLNEQFSNYKVTIIVEMVKKHK